MQNNEKKLFEIVRFTNLTPTPLQRLKKKLHNFVFGISIL